MQTVILCGGLGTRLREQMGLLPKPLVEISGRPILWHVMRIYAQQGFTEFVLCLGFGGAAIKEHIRKHPSDFPPHWNIQCVDTGLKTNTGGRIKRVESFVKENPFFATYADGVADIDLARLLSFHQAHGRIGTMTTVHPLSPFGEVILKKDGRATRFVEKPRFDRWINGGFFVFDRKVFRCLPKNSVLEKGPLESLARNRQLYAYQHTGFWCCMDTYKDTLRLNELCRGRVPPWMRKR